MRQESNTNSSASLFGWDFQINAAIVLFLEHIKEMVEIRVEGETEDIEITLNNGKKIYAQAKSVVDYTSNANVNEKLKKALETLNGAFQKGDSEKLIYITNSPNPFNNQKTMSSFVGFTRKKHDELHAECKRKIDKFCTEKSLQFKNDFFYIYVVPFENTNSQDKYKIIKQEVDDFVNDFDELQGKGKDFLALLQSEFFQNASLLNTTICISKKKIIWPLVVFATNSRKRIEESNLDYPDREELSHKYKEVINNACERFEFATRILTDYQNYKGTDARKKDKQFVENNWKFYLDDFTSLDLLDSLKENLIKIILRSIIDRKYFINKIKKEVNL